MASRTACSVSELAYSPPRMVQQDIDHSYTISLTPHNSIIQGNNVIFHIEGGTDFTDLANSFLEVELDVTTAAGEALAAGKAVCPINNIFHSLWSQVQVKLKDCIVSHPSPNYGYQAYIENLLNFSKQSKDTWMASVGWCMDQATKFDDVANTSLAARRTWVAGTETLKLRGKLSTDISNQPLLIPSHADIQITLTPQRSAFALLNFEAEGEFKLDIKSARLMVRKVKLYPARVAEFEKEIARAPIRLPIAQTKVTTVSISSGLSAFQQNAIFSGELPHTIVCGLVANGSYSGSKNKNPFNFQNADLNHIQLKVNELLVPTYPLNPSFDDSKVTEAYETLYDVVGRLGDDWSNGLTTADYCGGSALYGFTVAQDSLCRGDQPDLIGQIDISLKFGTPLPETMTLVIYSSTRAEVIIDKFRNVLLNV